MRDMRGRSRFRQLSITFSISRNAIGQSLLWKFAGELHWKKMASTSERKVGCVCFQFCFHSYSFKEKKRKRLGTRWREKQNGECFDSNCGRSEAFQWDINASLHTYSWRCELENSRTSMRITVVDPDFDGKSVKRTWKTLFWDNDFDWYRWIF